MDGLLKASPAVLRRRLVLGSACAALTAALGRTAQAADRLDFGVVPYLPARRLVAYYAPILPVISRSLGRQADFSIASSYPQHLARLRAHAFDVVADSLFIARIAQRELGHVPVARTRARLEPLLVVPAEHGATHLATLAGQNICVTDRSAALSIIGLRYLRDHGLDPEAQVHIIVSGSHTNSLHRMLAGEAAAAIVSRTTLKQAEPELAHRVRVLEVLPAALSAVVYHVAPHLAAQGPALGRALIEFANHSAEGRSFIDALGHEGLLPVTPAELASLDPMVVEFYRQLAVPEH